MDGEQGKQGAIPPGEGGVLRGGLRVIESGMGSDDLVIVRGISARRSGGGRASRSPMSKGLRRRRRGGREKRTKPAARPPRTRRPPRCFPASSSTARFCPGAFDHHYAGRPGGGLRAAGVAVSRDHAANGPRHLHLSRGQCAGSGRHGGRTHRAAGQRRRGHAVHAVAVSTDGTYQLTVTFKVGTDLNMAQVLVQNRVALAMPMLPDVVKQIGMSTSSVRPTYDDRQFGIAGRAVRPALPRRLRPDPDSRTRSHVSMRSATRSSSASATIACACGSIPTGWPCAT